MKPFVTFFKKLTVFSVFLLFVYVLLIYVAGEFLPKKIKPNINYKIGHNYLRLKEVKQTSNVDILFLGSSHAYRGFDTRIFNAAGYTIFNLGSSAQTPTQTLILLKRYLKQLNPKLVVFEVWPEVFTSDGVESSLDLIANDTNDLSTLQMVWDSKNMKVFNTYIYANIKNLIGSETNFEQKTYHDGGYVSQDKLNYNQDAKPNRTKLIFKNRQLTNFEAILGILKTEKVEYLLVQAPVTNQMYQSFTNISWFNAKIDGYGNHYNFNGKLKLDDTLDFYDNHHLNQKGVKLFNEAFLKLLTDEYKIVLQ